MVHFLNQVLEEEGLAENAARLAPIVQEDLLSSLNPSVATTVRGKGLLWAIVIKPQGGRDLDYTYQGFI